MISTHFCHRRSWIHLLLIMPGPLYKVLEWALIIRSNKPWEAISRHRGLGLSMKCFLRPVSPAPGPVSAHTLSWVHLSAGTELDYDGGSLFINATITLLNLQHNTLIGNLKLRSNISHAPAKLDVAQELDNIFRIYHHILLFPLFQAIQDV